MALLSLIVLGVVALCGAEIKVQVTRHFPCGARAGPIREKEIFRFSGYQDEDVRIYQIPNSNCMAVRNIKLEVNEPGLIPTIKYNALLEMRFGLAEHREKCTNADKNGCGGIGSCVQCDACSLREDDFIQFYKGHNRLKSCNASAGLHDDISLKVCLPSKEKILQLLDSNTSRAKQIWDALLKEKFHEKSVGLPVVLLIRLYDIEINTIEEKEDLMYGSKTGMIGCHYIRAIVTDE
uniref:Uncharacterized protein n=1 Tax=Plectus sambesii TaxID=2011161 RepID=A0A914VHM7_9BILA